MTMQSLLLTGTITEAFQLAGFAERPVVIPDGLLDGTELDYARLIALFNDDQVHALAVRAGFDADAPLPRGFVYGFAANILEHVTAAGLTTAGRDVNLNALSVAGFSGGYSSVGEYVASVRVRIRELRRTARRLGSGDVAEIVRVSQPHVMRFGDALDGERMIDAESDDAVFYRFTIPQGVSWLFISVMADYYPIADPLVPERLYEDLLYLDNLGTRADETVVNWATGGVWAFLDPATRIFDFYLWSGGNAAMVGETLRVRPIVPSIPSGDVQQGGGNTPTELGDGDVTTLKLADGAVTEPKLGAGSVTTTKIGEKAITSTKLNDFLTARLVPIGGVNGQIMRIVNNVREWVDLPLVSRVAPRSVGRDELEADIIPLLLPRQPQDNNANNGKFLGRVGGFSVWTDLPAIKAATITLAMLAADSIARLLPTGGSDGKFIGYAGGKPAWVDAPTSQAAGGGKTTTVTTLTAGSTRYNSRAPFYSEDYDADVEVQIAIGGGGVTARVPAAAIRDGESVVLGSIDDTSGGGAAIQAVVDRNFGGNGKLRVYPLSAYTVGTSVVQIIEYK